MTKTVRIALLTAPSGSGKGTLCSKLEKEGIAVLGHDRLAQQCRDMFRPNWRSHPEYGEGRKKHMIWKELRKECDLTRLVGYIYRDWWYRSGCPPKCVLEGWILKDLHWRRDATTAFESGAIVGHNFDFRLFTLKLRDIDEYASRINKQRRKRGKVELDWEAARESAEAQQRSFFDRNFLDTCDDPAPHEQHDTSDSVENALRMYLKPAAVPGPEGASTLES